MRVTVVGLGRMGAAFAGRALDEGHTVTVWNRSEGKAGDLVGRGATEVRDPREAVADAEVVLVVLTDEDAVASVVLDGGVAAALPGGAVLCDVSTVSAEMARRLAAEGPSGAVLDTPVLGSPQVIAAGGGRWFVGGPAEALATARPVLEDLGTAVVHCGGPGSGAVMKLVSNLQLVTGVAAMAEGIAIARSAGLGDDLLREAFADSPVLSPASHMRLDAVLDPAHPGWFGPTLARKDVRLAAALAAEGGVDARYAALADLLLTRVADAGGHWPDFAAVIEGMGPARGAEG